MKTREKCCEAIKKLSIAGFAAILAAALSFTGCESVENSSQILQANEAKIEAAKNELAIPAETVSDIDLPTILKGVAISWASSDEDVISSAGLVTRQPYDTAATLTATLTLGSASDNKEFDVTVTADVIEVVFEEEEAELVELSYWFMTSGVPNNLIKMIYPGENVIFNYRVDYGHSFVTEYKSAYTGDTVRFGSDIYDNAFIEILLKSGENIIGYALIEVYQKQGPFDPRADILKSVLLKQIDDKYPIEEYVKIAIEKIKSENRDAVKVAKAKEELMANWNTEDRLYLRDNFYGSTISWASSDEAVINSSTGMVTRYPLLHYITLTATITLGSVSEIKEFTVKVFPPSIKENGEPFELSIPRYLVGFTPPLSIKMIHTDENVVFHYNERFRLLGTDDIATKKLTARSGDIIYWDDHEDLKEGEDGKPINGERAIIIIVFSLEDNIIGYAAIRIAYGLGDYHVWILQSYIFPQVDGEYQNISEEYVNYEISKIYDSRGYELLMNENGEYIKIE